ncbi:MAG: hypothetical protein ACI8ZN_000050 [Bacteroidia bacterium]|jgi:hypothetical protein
MGDEALPPYVTYTKHIAPLINDHCLSCHRPNGTAPFSFTDYNEVIRKKKTIAKVVMDGIMPPWPADPSYSHFIGENVLTDLERRTIRKWVDQDCLFGDSAQLRALPKFHDLSNLGQPDLTIYLEPIEIEGNNRDKFFVVKSPIVLPKDTFIRAIEFVPGKDQIVHHLNGHLLNYDDDKKADVRYGTYVADEDQHPEAYLEAFESLRLFNDDGSKPERVHSAVNYLPGVIGTIYPEGVGGFKINRQSALVANDIHYAPIQKDAVDKSHYNLFFSATRPTRPTSELMLGTNGVSPILPPLVILPDTVMTFKTSFRIPNDISVLTVNPHMHLLGQRIVSYAVTPNSDTIPLIRINRWDFRWQYFYTYQTMLKIPAQSVIVVEATFNNTSANKNNPFDPPRKVTERYDKSGAGMRTTDEMFQFIITYLPYQAGDEVVSLEPEFD